MLVGDAVVLRFEVSLFHYKILMTTPKSLQRTPPPTAEVLALNQNGNIHVLTQNEFSGECVREQGSQEVERECYFNSTCLKFIKELGNSRSQRRLIFALQSRRTRC